MFNPRSVQRTMHEHKPSREAHTVALPRVREETWPTPTTSEAKELRGIMNTSGVEILVNDSNVTLRLKSDFCVYSTIEAERLISQLQAAVERAKKIEEVIK